MAHGEVALNQEYVSRELKTVGDHLGAVPSRTAITAVDGPNLDNVVCRAGQVPVAAIRPFNLELQRMASVLGAATQYLRQNLERLGEAAAETIAELEDMDRIASDVATRIRENLEGLVVTEGVTTLDPSTDNEANKEQKNSW